MIAVSITEQVTARFAQILRFMHAVSPNLIRDVDKEVAVMNPGVDLVKTFFA